MSGSATHTETIPPYEITVTQTIRRALSSEQLRRTDYFGKTAKRYAGWIKAVQDKLITIMSQVTEPTPDPNTEYLNLDVEIEGMKVRVTVASKSLKLQGDIDRPALYDSIEVLFVDASKQPQSNGD